MGSPLEYLLDKDCSAVVFRPPIPARLMKMPLSAGVTSMRINGIIAALAARVTGIAFA
jgi:hypothetical protein